MSIRTLEGGEDVEELLERDPDPEIRDTGKRGISEPEYRKYIAELNHIPNYGPDF